MLLGPISRFCGISKSAFALQFQASVHIEVSIGYQTFLLAPKGGLLIRIHEPYILLNVYLAETFPISAVVYWLSYHNAQRGFFCEVSHCLFWEGRESVTAVYLLAHSGHWIVLGDQSSTYAYVRRCS
jgi:hypothetical protein